MDEQSGTLKSGKNNMRTREGFFIEHGGLGKAGDIQVSSGDSGGASRFFYCAKASRGERNAGLEGMEEKYIDIAGQNAPESRANRGRNPNGIRSTKNNHPTVKPISLMSWLIKLVTREGQIALDPFLGSGTTGIAAHETDRKFIGIEREAEYIEIAKKRIKHFKSQPQQMEIGDIQ